MAKEVEGVWFQDEMRVGQKNKLTYRWARKGSRPRVAHDQRTQSTYLFGAVCPERGAGAALVLPACKCEAMQLSHNSSCQCGQSPPYPHAARNRNHGSVSSPRMIRSSVSTSTSQSTITRRDDSPFRCPSQAAPARSLPARIREWRQAAVRDTPSARRTGAGWKSHADAPSPIPAAQPKNSPRLSAAFAPPTIDGGDPCQQFQGD
jgi:DDE superfamily endonuclease